MRDADKFRACGGPAVTGRLRHLFRCLALSVLLATVGFGGGLIAAVPDARPTGGRDTARVVISLRPGAAPQAAAADRRDGSGPGVPARDGQFRFVVRAASCGAKTVGGRFLDATARGVFCQVDVSVRNVGRLPRAFDVSDQTAYDVHGQAYESDLTASVQANRGKVTFLAEVLPGERISRTLVFDVPAGARLTSIELRDSAWSRGVVVPLS